jgi:hypothetical protein
MWVRLMLARRGCLSSIQNSSAEHLVVACVELASTELAALRSSQLPRYDPVTFSLSLSTLQLL